ncbi:MAG: hypothetical protein K8S21_11150 [Gemmatimonadetes bacterium]|nr:hypothetical protein [Gemmatimonadota bacterium]
MRIVAVGECTIDRYPALGAERVGGISLNFAVNARREGAERVSLMSATGTDAGAAAVRRKLAAEGIDASHLRVIAGATATQAITLAPGGERIFPAGGYSPGVLADLHLSAADQVLLRTAEVVAVPVFRELAHLSDAVMHARGITGMRVADLLDGADLGPDLGGIESLLGAFDLLFLSGSEATVERLLPFSRDTRSLIVVTHGADGSSALVNGERITCPADAVPAGECVDSTGCGDAFQAAFTVDYVRHRDVHRALGAGSRRAAIVIRHLGATAELAAGPVAALASPATS